MHLQLLQRLIWGWDTLISVLLETARVLHTDPVKVTALQEVWQDSWCLAGTPPTSLHGSWNHQGALQPHQRKARIWVKPINTSLAINNPQLSVQENQLLRHLKCSTCTYMKILKGSFKRQAGERRRRRSWRCWVLPRTGAYSSFCLIAFASCLS